LTTPDLAARTLAELRARGWRHVALIWFALNCVWELVFAAAHPPGTAGSAVLIALALLCFLTFMWIAASALRRAAASPRSPWRIDGSLLFYAALHVALAVVIWLAAPVIDGKSTFGEMLLFAALPLVLIAPLAPWLVAVAVERPLALSPWRFLKQADAWFPPLLLITLALLLPLSLLQSWSSVALVGFGRGEIGSGLLQAMVSTLAEIASLALALTAYRSVAEG
jgi:hypothetical protein